MKFFSKLCLGAAFIAFSLPMMAQTASWRKGHSTVSKPQLQDACSMFRVQQPSPRQQMHNAHSNTGRLLRFLVRGASLILLLNRLCATMVTEWKPEKSMVLMRISCGASNNRLLVWCLCQQHVATKQSVWTKVDTFNSLIWRV